MVESVVLALSPELPESPPPPPFYFRPWLRLHTPTRHRNALWATASVVRRSPDRKRLEESLRPDASGARAAAVPSRLWSAGEGHGADSGAGLNF